MAKKNPRKLLEKAYDILSGVVSEQGEEGLGRYGDPRILGEIADYLGIGGDGAYYAMEYTSRLGGKPEKKWLVCMDPKNPDKSCVLSGMSSKEEAIAMVKSVEPNAVFKEAA